MLAPNGEGDTRDDTKFSGVREGQAGYWGGHSGVSSTLRIVPTLVPEPGSPTITQGNLTRIEFAEVRYVGCSWVTLSCCFSVLKIRVSVVD